MFVSISSVPTLWGLGRVLLKSFDPDERGLILWTSWVWRCFAAPLLLIFTIAGTASLWTALLGRDALQASHWIDLPLGLRRIILEAFYYLLCLAFDWGFTFQLFKPSHGTERKQIALWACSSNGLWIVASQLLVWLSLRGMD